MSKALKKPLIITSLSWFFVPDKTNLKGCWYLRQMISQVTETKSFHKCFLPWILRIGSMLDWKRNYLFSQCQADLNIDKLKCRLTITHTCIRILIHYILDSMKLA
jgi:hypothetical protein